MARVTSISHQCPPEFAPTCCMSNVDESLDATLSKR
jgi:hypothetical protein